MNLANGGMPNIILTAQNFDVYDNDGLDPFARTGATSALQIHRAGATGVILGHSEVGDTPEVVRNKLLTIVNKSAAHGPAFLKNITLLIGETWEEFQKQSAERVARNVTDHLLYILKDIPKEFLSTLVIGYEPKWGSRGSGHDEVPPPGPELISVVCKNIRSELATSIPIIYGGRSTPERTEEILADENVEGLILGSACNTVKKTMDIARVMTRVRPTKRKILHANFKAYDLPDSYQMYVDTLKTLGPDFVIYLSPCHADLREVREVIGGS